MSTRDRTESGWYQVNKQVFGSAAETRPTDPRRNRATGRIKTGEPGFIKQPEDLTIYYAHMALLYIPAMSIRLPSPR